MTWFELSIFRSQMKEESASESAAIRHQYTNEPSVACNQCVKNG